MSKKDFKAKIAKKNARSARKTPVEKAPFKLNKESLRNLWQSVLRHKKRTALVAATVVVVIVGVVLGIVWGSKAAKENAPATVQISADFTHEVPEGFATDDIITLRNDTAKEFLRKYGGFTNDELIPYEKGWYIFDEDGVARRYRDPDGNIKALPVADYKDAATVGTPLYIVGDVKMHFLVYCGESRAEWCYQYFVLSDKSDMEFLLAAMNSCGLSDYVQVSDTVVEIKWDATMISDAVDSTGMEEDTITNALTYFCKYYDVAR